MGAVAQFSPGELVRARGQEWVVVEAHWSPNHSAHIKQSHRVHYRWHPFHGLDVRELRRERHASGEFVRVEADPGEVALIAAWMLDPVACARLGSGEPLVSLSALVELHYFLIESGFRKHSRQNISRSREDTDENPSPDTMAVE